MKSTSLFVLAAFAAASFLSSCQQDPQSVNGGNKLPLKSSPPPANPAITYINSGIGVMDTTGDNATTIVTGTSGTTYLSPSWNYNGSMIAYSTVASGTYKIATVDVSVNSKGVPVGSNNTNIYSLAPSDSIRIQSGPTASATSSTGLVAFTRLHTDKADFGVTDLCTIPQSGGMPTVLSSYKRLNNLGMVLGLYNAPTWSPDDSKIAVVRQDTILHSTILIFNASTGAAEDSIPVSGNCQHLEWSRSGANDLAYSFSSGSAYDIYYVAPSTGSTPTTNNVAGGSPTWSPNNSSIMFDPTSGASEKLVPFTTSATTVGSSSFGSLNWKR
jgi:Tol biopolymer transport system component